MGAIICAAMDGHALFIATDKYSLDSLARDANVVLGQAGRTAAVDDKYIGDIIMLLADSTVLMS